jgi:hypothetical protein
MSSGGGPGPYWGFETIRTVMGRGKRMGGVAIVLGIGLVFLIPGALAGNLLVVAFGIALIALGCSWLFNAYRRSRPAARPKLGPATTTPDVRGRAQLPNVTLWSDG